MNTIATKGTAFIDEYGRERIFQGVNVVWKSESIPDWKEEDFRKLAANGVSLIRLGCVWAGVEPGPGMYKTEYLDAVAEALDWCEKYGIYAYLDFHQDLYSGFGHGVGDGAPRWATVDADKFQKIYIIWAEGYFIRKPVHRSFDAFWNNEVFFGKGLQDRYCEMLRFTANYLKDKPALMGWDVMNEPFPGTPGGKIFRQLVARGLSLIPNSRLDKKKAIEKLIRKDIMGALSCADDAVLYNSLIDAGKEEVRRFDLERYYPFFRKAAEAIRSVTDRGVIFMENCYYSNLGIPCSTPKLTYNDGTEEKNLAFAPHGYDITVDTPLTNKASPFRVDMIFDEHTRTQARLGVPVLVGEWGGMVPGDTEYPALEHLIRKFDGNLWSQTYWHFNKNLFDCEIGKILSRPYPVAVAGKIVSYTYSRAKKEFVLHYTGNPDCKEPTRIFLGEEPKSVLATGTWKTETTDNGCHMLTVEPTDGKSVVIVTL